VFLDSERNVKIGDFGLATTGRQKVSLAPQNVDLSKSTNITRPGVGTPFYSRY
jgi:hypothetical protein